MTHACYSTPAVQKYKFFSQSQTVLRESLRQSPKVESQNLKLDSI
jgi:hypothetical protein